MLPITAVEMANAANVPPSKFRKALRGEQKRAGVFTWHHHNDRWIFDNDGDYKIAQRILDSISN